ncbi:unnamed protein product, partial [Amoebophrya sp. A25]
FIWTADFAPRGPAVVSWVSWAMAAPLHTASAVGSLFGTTCTQLGMSWRWTLVAQAVQWATLGTLLARLPRQVLDVPYLNKKRKFEKKEKQIMKQPHNKLEQDERG